jgi:APA family basic amino acid/polyamine antiporter
MGMLVSLALMLSLHALTWEVFLIWLVIGLFVYGLYSRKHSKVQQELRGVSGD